MRHFALAFFGTFLIGFGAIWTYVAHDPMAYLDPEYPIWVSKVQMAQQCNLGKLTIMGDSSMATSLDPASIGPGVVNLALISSTPIENYYFARKFLSCKVLPKAVILSFSTARLLGWSGIDYQGHTMMDFEDMEDLRHHSLPYEPPEQHALELIVKEWGYVYHFPTYYSSALLAAFLHPREEINHQLFNQIIADHGFYIYPYQKAVSTDLSPDVPMHGFAPSPLLDSYFHALLDLFESHNIPVYYIKIPYDNISLHALDPVFIKDFTEYLNSMAAKHPNFHLLGPLFSGWPLTAFDSGTHMNSAGAILYSDAVRKMLNEAHVEGGPFIPDITRASPYETK